MTKPLLPFRGPEAPVKGASNRRKSAVLPATLPLLVQFLPP